MIYVRKSYLRIMGSQSSCAEMWRNSTIPGWHSARPNGHLRARKFCVAVIDL